MTENGRGNGYSEVNNEPGEGWYEMCVEGNNSGYERRVPAIDGAYQSYEKGMAEKGELIIAYRAGPKGQCVIRVNPEKLGVKKMVWHALERFETGQYILRHLNLPHSKFHDPYYIGVGLDGLEPKIYIEGEMLENGTPFKATISYHSQTQETSG